MAVNILQMEISTWLLLLYTLPTKRTTARVTLWRKLRKFGAVQLKTSGYVLPNDATQFERFQWLAKQIRDAGGDATLVRVAQIEGLANEQIVQMFNQARAAEYKELVATCRSALAGRKQGKDGELAALLDQQQRRFREIREIDYFKSPSADDAQMVLQRIEKLLLPKKSGAARPR